jgi:predicted acylesterase/phospholipase RssA
MTQLRIAMTLPGEASLGAFQAGAISALIVALQEIKKVGEHDVRLDAITAASSGSLTAVLGAHALLTGQDPVPPLRRAWVVEPTIEALRGRDGRAPLSLERAREVAAELLVVKDGVESIQQAGPIMVHFAMTCLRGLTYTIEPAPRESENEIVPAPDATTATSYLDWAVHWLKADSDWADAVDTAIASASHPAAFAPTLLDREELAPFYEANGVDRFPRFPELWYADGGLVDREPLGRCIDVVSVFDGDGAGERVILLLRPQRNVGFEEDDAAWTGDDEVPAWKTVLARALRIIVTHSLYEDLRRVERVNSRIRWQNQVTDLLDRLVPEGREDEIIALIDDIRAEKGTQRPDEARESAQDKKKLLELLIAEATGLAGKRPIDVHVVSPRSAGDVVGGSLLNFGGFLAERLRANDFLVGYVAMRDWMDSCGGPPFQGEPLKEVARKATEIPGWIGGIAGRRRLSWRDRADVARVVGRAARIGLRGNSRPRV